jgi:hypothetical protein
MILAPHTRTFASGLTESSGMGGVIGWSLVLLALVVAGFYAVVYLRRWLKEDDVPSGGIGFTLSDLRQLHREGKMTDEEFERARAKFVAAGKAMAEKLPDPLAGRRPRGETPPPQAATAPDATGFVPPAAPPRQTPPVQPPVNRPTSNQLPPNRPNPPRTPPSAPPGAGGLPPGYRPPPPQG